MNACASRVIRLSLLLMLPWLGSGCASIAASVRGPEGEITEKARRLCELGLLSRPDLSLFPADMRPEDSVRPEDLAYLQAHPEFPPPSPPPSQPLRCEVKSPPNTDDGFATVQVKLRPGAEADGLEAEFPVDFVQTSAGWRLAYWFAEEGAVSPLMAAAQVPIFSSESMTRPEKLSGEEVAYTREAIEKRIQGQMAIRCVITREGGVSNCHSLKSLPLMTPVALKALWGSRFAPATLDGKPLSVRYMFHFNLHLPR
ncbi:energy transducer TonB [Corallococcus sp. bb12-1]|uniref:energy transducer TonB n=1 Tax=Corallococcus sp. bb12-1 TaxID=2996784 RepID=UPI0022707BE9|nr:energy transducer TonB [Corallococcus sp. bb12-1]MCY1040326.1 energy transducer TonB [Corallococcus sp. bb12-1]